MKCWNDFFFMTCNENRELSQQVSPRIIRVEVYGLYGFFTAARFMKTSARWVATEREATLKID